MASEQVGSIHYDLDLKKDKFDSKAKEASSQANSISKGLKSIAPIAKAAAAAITVVAVASAGFAAQGIKVAAELESTTAGLEALLGSAEKAEETMERIKKEAARTPFEIPGLSKAVQLMTAVTKDGNKAVDIVLDVGEALSAMRRGQEELDRIIFNLQQIASVGKASMLDVKQFAFAGIPIFDMLSQETGIAKEAMGDFIKDGGVTFELLKKMFKKATSEGGRFFGAFEKQQGTFNQLWANMQDSVNIFLADFVESSGIFDLVKQAVKGFTDFLTNLSAEIQKAGGAIEFLKQKFEESGIPAFIKAVVDQFTNLWNIIAPALLPSFQRLFESIATKLLPALQKLWDILAPILLPVLSILAGVLGGLLVGAIAVITEGLNILVNIIAILADAFAELIRPIKEFITKLVGNFKDLPGKIGEAFKFIVYAITAPFAEGFKWIQEQIDKFLGEIRKLSDEVKNITGQGIVEAEAKLKTTLDVRNTPEFKARLAEKNIKDGKGAGPTNVTINMSGVMTSSNGELRNVANKLATALNQTIKSKNLAAK